MKPRPYQSQAKKELYSNWKDGPIAQMLVMPTGGGKTVTFVDIIRDFISKGKRVMMIAHREELISQSHQTLYKRKIYAGIIKAGYKPAFHLPCQVASIQTIQNRKKLPKTDLVIFDEAHHVQDFNSYGIAIKKHFQNSFILGVTATPYRLSGKGFTNVFARLVLTVTFNDLVKMGYLTPYKYFIGSTPDLSKARVQQGEYNQEDVREAMGLAPLVESYEQHCLGMKGIVFCVNVDHSREVVQKYQDAGYTAEHIDGNTPRDERKAILKRFSDGVTTILCNVGIATEGTDIPSCEFVQLARPTMSLSLFLQMVGRSCRTIWDEIKDCETDSERKKAVENGSKPFAYVLDNAGCYRKHGMPDQDRDWKKYFEGWKKEKEQRGMIEVFVVEDEKGQRKVVQNPEEVDGLILVEVTQQMRKRVVNLTSIKEFDKQFRTGYMLMKKGKVKKPGWFAFYKYKEYCEKNMVYMNADVWDYLEKRLVDDRRAKIDQYENEILSLESVNNNLFGENESQSRIDKVKKMIQEAKACGVPSVALKKERSQYLSKAP